MEILIIFMILLSLIFIVYYHSKRNGHKQSVPDAPVHKKKPIRRKDHYALARIQK
jgi:hypothetical protein